MYEITILPTKLRSKKMKRAKRNITTQPVSAINSTDTGVLSLALAEDNNKQAYLSTDNPVIRAEELISLLAAEAASAAIDLCESEALAVSSTPIAKTVQLGNMIVDTDESGAISKILTFGHSAISLSEVLGKNHKETFNILRESGLRLEQRASYKAVQAAKIQNSTGFSFRGVTSMGLNRLLPVFTQLAAKGRMRALARATELYRQGVQIADIRTRFGLVASKQVGATVDNSGIVINKESQGVYFDSVINNIKKSGFDVNEFLSTIANGLGICILQISPSNIIPPIQSIRTLKWKENGERHPLYSVPRNSLPRWDKSQKLAYSA
jgi:hypothetical protein